jgi:hypothetical protein
MTEPEPLPPLAPFRDHGQARDHQRKRIFVKKVAGGVSLVADAG